MRVCIIFPDDKPYLDLETERMGICIRIWPNALSDGTWNQSGTEDIPNDWVMDQLFKVNDKITGLFYLSNKEQINQ